MNINYMISVFAYKAQQKEIKQLRSALEYARPLVEKWCHYQGDDEQFVKDTLKPIDLALNKEQKE